MKLDRDTIEAVDPEGMLGDVLAQPLQLGDALWRAESAGIRPSDRPGGLVVCGMGGSAIGGIPETQEMLDYCAERGIYPDCEMIRMDEVNEAYERLLRNDVRYRFVIDMSSMQAAE